MPSRETRVKLRNAIRGDQATDEIFNLIYETTGNTFYVSSLSGKSANDGRSIAEALATLDQAMAKCEPNQGDVVILMPGHNEGSSAAATWDIDVAGVSVVGLGRGTSRPRFDFDNAAASIDIGANNCTLKNVTLLPSVTDVLVGVDVEAAVTNTLIEDVEALPGEDAAGVDDFAVVVDLKVGCTTTIVRRLKVRQHASGAGYIAGVQLNGASDDVLIDDCDIYILGAGVLAPINGLTTLSTNFRALNNILMTDAEPCIEMFTGTTGVLGNNWCFTDLATIDAAIVADGCANFDNLYVEVAPEAGAGIGTLSIDD